MTRNSLHITVLSENDSCSNSVFFFWMSYSVACVLECKEYLVGSRSWTRYWRTWFDALTECIVSVIKQFNDWFLVCSRHNIHSYTLQGIHTYITICIARCVDSTEYMSNQRRWRQSPSGGQLLASNSKEEGLKSLSICIGTETKPCRSTV